MKFLILITILLSIINIVISNDADKAAEEARKEKQRLEKEAELKELQDYGRNMSKYMDRNVNPCDDFYRYSCGNWHKYHKIPSGKTKISQKDLLNNIYIQQLHEILSASSEFTIVNERFDLAKNYYLACTETDILEKRDVHEIKQFIKHLGGMPLIHTDWKESDFNVTRTLLNLKKQYNIDILIGLTFSNDFRNHRIRALYFGETPLSPIPRNYYFDIKHKSKLVKYRELMSKFLQKLGIDYEKSEALSTKFLSLEKEILKGPLVDITTALKVRTVAELSKEYFIRSSQKYFNVYEYIHTVLGFSIPDTLEVIETNHYYIKYVLEVIEKTENKMLANYIMYKVAEIFMYNNFDRNGKLIKGSQRTEYCVKQTMKFFPQITSQMYYNKYKNSATIPTTLTDRLKKSLRQYLPSIQQQQIKDMKVENLKYDQKDLNKHQISNHNNITNQEYFKNTKAMMQFYANHWHEQYYNRDNNEIDKLDIKPLELNAYYTSNNHGEKKVLVPATLLQNPFYHSKYPKSINFAKYGIYLARAFAHVNDNFTRSKYAFENDFLRNWWKQDDEFAYNHLGGIADDKIKCYQDQIQNSEFAENIPEDESFAVSGGVQTAFTAYLNYIEKLNYENVPDYEILKNETIHGLDLTNTQLFFVAYAQNWCKASKKKDDKLHIYTSLANFKEFATDFRCSEGSWMRPKNLCYGYIYSSFF